MKIILGDNQFFGVNHFDLEKGQKTKLHFNDVDKIKRFIDKSLSIGMDGFMINSNEKGYEIIDSYNFNDDKEIHYSIPYPHKYANMINENGMMSLFKYVYKHTSIINNIIVGSKLLVSRNLKQLVPLALDLEIPKNLKKGSYIYIQNIVTDLLIGMGRGDILIHFIQTVVKMGYKPGIITLNPVLLDNILKGQLKESLLKELVICFNVNKEGFNVFPSRDEIESLIKARPEYKLMGMSIFASGAANISSSIEYVKKLELDYVVFGTSKIENLHSNLKSLKNKAS